jgi:hypothetical protein
MSRCYRALLSVPIFVDDDDAAFEVACSYTSKLRHRDGADAICGHLELLGECDERGELLEVRRIVHSDPGLVPQVRLAVLSEP